MGCGGREWTNRALELSSSAISVLETLVKLLQIDGRHLYQGEDISKNSIHICIQRFAHDFWHLTQFFNVCLGPEKGKSKSGANCSLKYESESEKVSCGADVQLARDLVGGLIWSGC